MPLTPPEVPPTAAAAASSVHAAPTADAPPPPEIANVTDVLGETRRGQVNSARMLPLVYAELRRLASQRLALEPPGQTLQPTALVHEAYLRLVDVPDAQEWEGRGHFFAAAAESMRRILVER